MLGFFAAKSDHPLADPKESKRIYADLAEADVADAMDDAATLLESLAVDHLVTLEQRVGILLQLDTAAQPAAFRFSRVYAAGEYASRNEELKQWRLGYAYWSQLAEGYAQCVRELVANPKTREAVKSDLTLLLVRALHAQSVSLKWQQFRYGPLDDGFWQHAGEVYLNACTLKLHASTVACYTQQPTISPERMYLKLLAFYASSMDSLLPLEIEMADKVLDDLLPQFQLSWQEASDSVYWIDAAQNVPPTRLAVKPAPAATVRYFNPGKAVATAQKLRSEISDTLPSRFNLGPAFTSAMLIEVLDHLAMYWSPIPPQRSHPRHRVKSRTAVLTGLGEAYKRLLIGASDDDVSIASWIVEDVSQGGLRAHATMNGMRLSVNSLLLMRPEGGNNWLLGVIRRLAKDTENSGSIGVETLSKQPLAMNVDSGGIRTEVVLLDPWETSAQVRVALPAKAWEDNIPMVFEANGRPVKLVPDAQVQAGPDYLIGKYRVRVSE